MLDPKELYRLNARVAEEYLADTDEVLLLHCFQGFLDAGAAGRGAVEHLLSQFPHERIVTFDGDQIMDYHTKRPSMTYVPPAWVSMARPGPVIDAFADANGLTVLLLHGAEPDMQWERFTTAVIGLVDQFGITATVGMYGVPMAVPHTRPLRMSATGTKAELVARYPARFGPSEVPGSLGALLELRLGESGMDALTYVAHVPYYFASVPYQTASRSLLGAVEAFGGLDLCVDRIDDLVAARESELAAQVVASPRLAAQVAMLEEKYDSASRPDRLGWDDGSPVPSAEEIAEQFEAFLHSQHQTPPGPLGS